MLKSCNIISINNILNYYLLKEIPCHLPIAEVNKLHEQLISSQHELGSIFVQTAFIRPFMQIA